MSNTKPVNEQSKTNTTITLNDFLNKGKDFIIPYYQRGYIWGKSRRSEKNSVQYILESIINCLENKSELFLQGVTVCEDDKTIELIDGQQRTTFFYLLLKYLEYDEQYSLVYSIRTESQKFLDKFKSNNNEINILYEAYEVNKKNEEEKFQDIYYFKKTVYLIHKYLEGREKKEILSFVLANVKFLYINVPKEKAITVFSMMNGNKAVMKFEEIIKAEMLRLISADKENNNESIRWEQNLLRSKYAREWDKWLYWWNRKEVKDFYHTENVMGLLVETYFYSKNDSNLKFNFENFRDKFLRGENNELLTKNTFYKLRHLQKQFEDVFNSVNDDKSLHNKIGAILTILNKEDRKSFIRSYFIKNEINDIDLYLKLSFLGITHSKIKEEFSNNKSNEERNVEKEDVVSSRKVELINILSDNDLYKNNDKEAYKQLLRLNIDADTKLGRAFDFSIVNEKSLEHIHPQSKVYYLKDSKFYSCKEDKSINIDESYFDKNDFDNQDCSEHCIGNLVLLYKNENSAFSNHSFKDKKKVYFNLNSVESFKSRHLLHSLSVFAKDKWNIDEIKKNKHSIINELKEYYGIQ